MKKGHRSKHSSSGLKGVFDALISRLDSVVQPPSKSGDFKSRLDQYQVGLSVKSTMNYEQDQLEQLDASLTKNLETKRQEIAGLKARLNRLSQDLIRAEKGEPLPSRGMESAVLTSKLAKKETMLHEIERAIRALEKENADLASRPRPAQSEDAPSPDTVKAFKAKAGEAHKLQSETKKELEQAQREGSIAIKKISEEIEKRSNEINVLEMQLRTVEGRIDLMTRAGKIPKKTIVDRRSAGSDAEDGDSKPHKSMIAVRQNRAPSPVEMSPHRTKLPSLSGSPAKPPEEKRSGLPRPTRYTPKKEEREEATPSPVKAPDSDKKVKSGLPRPRYAPKKQESEEPEEMENSGNVPPVQKEEQEEETNTRFEFLLGDEEEDEDDETFTIPGVTESTEEVAIDLMNATCDTEIRVTDRKEMPNGFEMTFYHIVDRIPKYVE